MKNYDVIILGAGAAGLFCAMHAGARGRSVLLLDHADKAGKKILISGGGKCNFTNLYCDAEHYISQNPYFSISALSRYTPYDILALLEKHHIAWEEREHGQLFCKDSAAQMVQMLLAECAAVDVHIRLQCEIEYLEKKADFIVRSSAGLFTSTSLVVATGSRSIPKMGATGFGHQLAQQFDIAVTPLKPGLVPLRLTGQEGLQALAGISLQVAVHCRGHVFCEKMLFTHRGISGPAILQISSYWQEGDSICIDLLPDVDVEACLQQALQTHPKALLQTVLSEHLPQCLPKRLAQYLCKSTLPAATMKSLSESERARIVHTLHHWFIKPAGSEGYRTAEVTVGGVDTNELSSKTMQAKKVEGLYFIGEVVDVTGHLGGFNFQWAWASGYAAGQYV